MLNPDLKLNSKLFDSSVELKSMRAGFGEGLLKAAEIDKRVVGLCADLTESTHFDLFKQKFPDRFIEVGVAEQNLVTVASGMAAMGKIPFIGSYAIFSPGKNWEQIRTTVCYNNRPVKIVGSHAGVSVGPDGGSHQALEDIAITRVLPRMVVISPCDAIEAKKAAMAAAKTDDPTYIRLARNDTPVLTMEETPFEIGKAMIVFRSQKLETGSSSSLRALQSLNGLKLGETHGKSIYPSSSKLLAPSSRLDVGIIATGPLLYKALLAAKQLDVQGKKVAVMNLSTIKPLDEDAVIKLAHDSGAIVTVEDHQIAGGMGSAVAECLAAHFPVPIEFVGVKDKFGQSGTPEELIELYGLGEKSIVEAVHRAMLRKS
jgi:transketolase